MAATPISVETEVDIVQKATGIIKEVIQPKFRRFFTTVVTRKDLIRAIRYLLRHWHPTYLQFACQRTTCAAILSDILAPGPRTDYIMNYARQLDSDARECVAAGKEWEFPCHTTPYSMVSHFLGDVYTTELHRGPLLGDATIAAGKRTGYERRNANGVWECVEKDTL
jgi:hypothetical protein